MTMRTLLLAAGIAPLLLAGGCSGTPNRGLESVHQPIVSRTDYAFDLATAGGGLAPGEAERLAGWMASLRLGYGDQVAIDDPNPYGTGVRYAVSREVSRYGLLVSEERPLTASTITPGMVRIVVSRTRASVPGCPDFSRAKGPEFESNTYSNQGCAINSNIAAMIANPADLVRGQIDTGLNDPHTSGKAVNTYRVAPPTGAAGPKVVNAGGKE